MGKRMVNLDALHLRSVAIIAAAFHQPLMDATHIDLVSFH